MNFEYLGLAPETLRAVEEAGYTTPTPIQAQAIPVVLQGRDVLGIAQTGTGKTAGFTLPMIDILSQGRARARMPRSLILEPTRELAAQVAQSFETYGKYHKLNMALLIGGVSFEDQERKLDRGVDVLIATPGRLLDHFGRGKLMMTGVDILVIDEADRMLDMGFIPDVERICSLITKKHQTLFFSATMPREIQGLVSKFLTDPKRIEVAPPSSTAATVEQFLVPLHTGEAGAKRARLRELLRGEEIKNAIVFCNRKRDVDVVFRSLKRHGFNAAALHGDMDQGSRMEVLDSFKGGNVQLLVASDVAARGLDIPAMSHVFNYDVPSHAEDYIHRIGRTGRAGRSGRAFMISTPADSKWLRNVQSLIGKAINVLGAGPKAESMAQPAAESATIEPDMARDDAGEKRGKRRRRRGGRGRDAREASPSPAEAQTEQRAEASPPPRENRDAQPRREDQPRREEPRRQEARQDDHRRNDQRRDDRRDRSDRGHDRGRDRNRDRDRRYREDDFEPVLGLGDHVPEFLLRTFKIAPIPADDDEDEIELEIEEVEADADAAQPVAAAEEAPAERKSKRKRRSRGKKRTDGAEAAPEIAEDAVSEPAQEAAADAAPAEETQPETPAAEDQPAAAEAAEDQPPAKPKPSRKPRTRARKAEAAPATEAGEAAPAEAADAQSAPKKPARRTTARAKKAAEPEAAAEPAPKATRTRARSTKAKAAAETETTEAASEAPDAKPKTARKPRAPRKSPAKAA
ncbi:MAG: DEAD/DEAH box helicase [Sphingomonadales bacterium]